MNGVTVGEVELFRTEHESLWAAFAHELVREGDSLEVWMHGSVGL
jgi:predicted transcriptional regulator